MKSLILSLSLILALPTAPVQDEDFFELLSFNLVSNQFITMGAPTDKGYQLTFEGFGAFDGGELVNGNNIIRIPYEFNIDSERLAQATYDSYTYVWDFVPLYTTDYHYNYFALVKNSSNTIVAPYDINPFAVAQFDNNLTWRLTIPTNHATAQAVPALEISGGNNKWYMFDTGGDYYQEGLEDGFDLGFEDGYNQGLDFAYTNPEDDVFNPVFSLLSNGFKSITSLLAIPLFPGFSLGTLLFLPVIVGIGYGLIKLLMGSGK